MSALWVQYRETTLDREIALERLIAYVYCEGQHLDGIRHESASQ